jgi:hypothetical protein
VSGDRWTYKTSPAIRTKRWLFFVALVAAGLAVAAVSLGGSTPEGRIIVWIEPGASGAQLHLIAAHARAALRTSDCVYWSQAKDFKEAKRLLAPSTSAFLTAASTPSSFRCNAPSPPAAAIEGLRSTRGVITVTLPPGFSASAG